VTEPVPAKGDAKPVGTLLNELVGMVIAYFRQETVDPLKSLGRYLAIGVAGALLMSLGAGLLTLTVIRLLQVETGRHLQGNLNWVPYAGGFIVAAAGTGYAISRIGKGTAPK
jgi:hypothetical protein